MNAPPVASRYAPGSLDSGVGLGVADGLVRGITGIHGGYALGDSNKDPALVLRDGDWSVERGGGLAWRLSIAAPSLIKRTEPVPSTVSWYRPITFLPITICSSFMDRRLQGNRCVASSSLNTILNSGSCLPGTHLRCPVADNLPTCCRIELLSVRIALNQEDVATQVGDGGFGMLDKRATRAGSYMTRFHKQRLQLEFFIGNALNRVISHYSVVAFRNDEGEHWATSWWLIANIRRSP